MQILVGNEGYATMGMKIVFQKNTMETFSPLASNMNKEVGEGRIDTETGMEFVRPGYVVVRSRCQSSKTMIKQ